MCVLLAYSSDHVPTCRREGEGDAFFFVSLTLSARIRQ